MANSSVLASSFSLPIDLTGDDAILSSTFQSANSTITSPPSTFKAQLEAAHARISQLTAQLQQEESESRVLENRATALAHQVSLLQERDIAKDAKIEELKGRESSTIRHMTLFL